MKNLRLTLFVLTLVVLAKMAEAQASKDFPKQVNLVKMTDPGVAVIGTDDALYGLDKAGKVLWDNKKLRKVEENRVEVLSGSELIFVSDKGLLSRNRVINVLDGKEYANTGTKGENIMGARVVHGANQLWVMPGNKQIDVWDIDTNKKLYSLEINAPYGIATDKMASLTATFSGMQPITYTGKKSAILHLGLAHLGNYNLSTGKPIWMFDWKPYKVKKPNGDKGDRASKPSTGSAVMRVDQKAGVLYFPFRTELIAVDIKTGAAKWSPKANKTGKVRDMFITDEGILILTIKGLQLVDKQSGAEKWDKPIKIKGAAEGLLIKDNKDFYIVSKNNLVKVDIAKKSAKTLTEKIKFQGGESFSQIEIIDDMVVLSGSQNIVGIDKTSGKIVYSTYYKAPGAGLVALAQNMVLATVAMASSMNSMNVNSQAGNNTYYSYTPRMMSSGGSATTSAGDIMYISTKFKDSDAKGFGVARVDKLTGKTLDKIVIGDRNPVYAVDERNGLIFYKSAKSSVALKAVQ
ncbi:MAG: hypothetical protein Roseis3KO_41790 [Roseivirga sp.]